MQENKKLVGLIHHLHHNTSLNFLIHKKIKLKCNNLIWSEMLKVKATHDFLGLEHRDLDKLLPKLKFLGYIYSFRSWTPLHVVIIRTIFLFDIFWNIWRNGIGETYIRTGVGAQGKSSMISSSKTLTTITCYLRLILVSHGKVLGSTSKSSFAICLVLQIFYCNPLILKACLSSLKTCFSLLHNIICTILQIISSYGAFISCCWKPGGIFWDSRLWDNCALFKEKFGWFLQPKICVGVTIVLLYLVVLYIICHLSWLEQMDFYIKDRTFMIIFTMIVPWSRCLNDICLIIYHFVNLFIECYRLCCMCQSHASPQFFSIWSLSQPQLTDGSQILHNFIR